MTVHATEIQSPRIRSYRSQLFNNLDYTLSPEVSPESTFAIMLREKREMSPRLEVNEFI